MVICYVEREMEGKEGWGPDDEDLSPTQLAFAWNIASFFMSAHGSSLL